MDIFTQETEEQEWTIYNCKNKKDESHKQNAEQNKPVTKDFKCMIPSLSSSIQEATYILEVSVVSPW